MRAGPTKPLVLTPHGIRRAERHLSAADPIMAGIIGRVGRCGLGRSRREDPFTAAIEAIVWQQLSTKAAATIYARFLTLFPGGRPTPSALLATSDTHLRAAGLSRAKVAYLHDLARKVSDGSVPIHALDHLPDEDVVTALTSVKGIGRWSAEMFLMFRLQRADVLPVGDLGIVKGFQRHYRMRKAPTPERMTRIAEHWRPYRSVGAWYLWAAADVVPGGD
jgi:DNA-3-methyladenine glycosylase II